LLTTVYNSLSLINDAAQGLWNYPVIYGLDYGTQLGLCNSVMTNARMKHVWSFSYWLFS
jgi:hypothetical protein